MCFDFTARLFLIFPLNSFSKKDILIKENIAKDKIITNLFEIAPQVRMGTFSDNCARG